MDLCGKREDMALQGGDSCLTPRASRGGRGGCEMESRWAEGLLEGGGRKRRVPEESEDDVQEMDEVIAAASGASRRRRSRTHRTSVRLMPPAAAASRWPAVGLTS